MTLACVVVALIVAMAARHPSRPGEAEARPVTDRDGDGVADAVDRCPDRAGLEPDGCPPRDTDGDGVLDHVDACPEEPGPRELRGCPDTDADGDGVVDRHDRCPDVFGDPRFDGCVAPDRDGDGVPDALDRCPDRPEVWNGVSDGDGCPDAGAELVRLVPGRVAVLDGKLERPGGGLSRRGRRGVDVLLALLDVAGAQRVRVAVPGGGREADVRALAAALRAARPRLDVALSEAPLVSEADAARLGRRWRARVEVAFE